MPAISQLTQVSPTGTDIVQVLQGGANKKTTVEEVSGLKAVGYGQSWQDLTGSRALDVIYTNTSGKPIGLAVNGSAATGGTIHLTVNGVEVNTQTQDNSYSASATTIVPDGSTYKVSVDGGMSLTKWLELS